MARPSDLPNFRKPPIDEVALGLQFDRIEGYTTVHSGLLWHDIRKEYPRSESRPRVDVPIEDLKPNRSPSVPSQIVSLDAQMAGGRTWLIDESDSHLIQLQDSQFLHNWRRRGDEYPQLDEIVERFWREYARFVDLLAAEGFGQPVLRQLEVSYFNWIPTLSASAFLRPATTVELSTASLGPDPEDFEFAMRVLDHSEDDDHLPSARLSVECQSAFRVDEAGGTTGHRLVLSYKAPVGPAAERSEIDLLIAAARRSIVNTFTDLTTDEAHQLWERVL